MGGEVDRDIGQSDTEWKWVLQEKAESDREWRETGTGWKSWDPKDWKKRTPTPWHNFFHSFSPLFYYNLRKTSSLFQFYRKHKISTDETSKRPFECIYYTDPKRNLKYCSICICAVQNVDFEKLIKIIMHIHRHNLKCPPEDIWYSGILKHEILSRHQSEKQELFMMP